MTSNPSVIIIGAGMTGIAAAYYLRANGIPYTILEAKSDLGGVWNTHRWHGARCDSDFIKYSFSFKPFLSAQCLQSREQIHEYLHGVAREFSIAENIRFGCRVDKAVFHPQEQRWAVHTSGGVFGAQFLINGNGYFADEPHVPAFLDAEKFKGEIIHTSHLDGRRSFTGKKVVVVGSGATAICCAPELSRVSKSVVLLQRSPSYIYEISNQAGFLIRLCQELYRLGVRGPVQWLRHYLQLRDDLVFVGFRRFPRFARWFFRRHWLGAVGAEAFRRDFTPRYNPWEQRIAVAIGLKDALRSGRLSIKTGEIKRFAASSIELANGESIECDVCVAGHRPQPQVLQLRPVRRRREGRARAHQLLQGGHGRRHPELLPPHGLMALGMDAAPRTRHPPRGRDHAAHETPGPRHRERCAQGTASGPRHHPELRDALPFNPPKAARHLQPAVHR